MKIAELLTFKPTIQFNEIYTQPLKWNYKNFSFTELYPVNLVSRDMSHPIIAQRVIIAHFALFRL